MIITKLRNLKIELVRTKLLKLESFRICFLKHFLFPFDILKRRLIWIIHIFHIRHCLRVDVPFNVVVLHIPLLLTDIFFADPSLRLKKVGLSHTPRRVIAIIIIISVQLGV